jgi:hypothetical protein
VTASPALTDPTARSVESAVRERREAARVRDLTVLLRQRPELAEVHQPAAFAAEAALWGV